MRNVEGGGSRRLLPSPWMATWCVVLVVVAGCGDSDPVAPRANHAPVLVGQADTVGVRGDTLRLVALGGDSDGDGLIYDFVVIVTTEEIHRGYRAKAGMEQGSGRFWFVPDSMDVPSRSFWFTAEDGRGGADTVSFAVHTP